jgi:hypothetical protein
MRFKNNHARLAMLGIGLAYATFSRAQFLDSLQATTGIKYRFSSKSYLPFWLVSNQHGTVADRKNDLSPFFHVSNKHVIAEHEYQDERGLYDYHDLSVSYGVSIYNTNHFKSTILEQGYVKLEYCNWSLRAGRFEETTGDIDPVLSSGSLGISGNALPIPKIGIAVTDYTNLPFTNGWVQFKGTFAHGWLGNNRYIKKSYYHEKTLFMRIGRGDLKFYAGIEHFAEWGGDRGNRHYDRSAQAFRDVIFIKGSDNSNSGAREVVYGGDHRGVLDGGIYWENDNTQIHGYVQKPFEGKRDISLKNKNMLAGVIVSLKNKSQGLQKILAEIISTTSINYDVPAMKRESFYNNSVYKTGWQYEDNIIGTPLFTDRIRGNKYFPEIQPFDWNAADTAIPGNANIVNNRVFAFHIGASYSVSEEIGGKTLLTYTRNYGDLNYSPQFTPGKTHFYGLQEIYYEIPHLNLRITAGLGIDWAQMTKGALIGGLLGIEWNIMGHINRNEADY